MVATVGETTGLSALASIRRRMLLDATGRRILRERPVITEQTIDLERLRKLPATTFGHAYTRFMDRHSFSPDGRPTVSYLGGNANHDELAYIILRYRQVHDFWHTLLGMPISVESEIAVKAFEYSHTGLPLGLISTLGGQLRLTSTERTRLFFDYIPWMMQNAASCKFLINVMYEELLDDDLENVRRQLGFLPKPVAVKRALAEARAESARSK